MRNALFLALVAACGSSNNNNTDGTQIDAPVSTKHDAPTAKDAPEGIDAPKPIDGSVTLIDSAVPVDGTVAVDGTVTVDGAPATCAIASPAFATYTASSGAGADIDTADATQVEYEDEVNDDATPDVLDLQLYAGFGSITTDDITATTYTLVPDDYTFDTCGACILMYGDVDFNAMTVAGYWMANAGSVTITSLQPNLTGHLDNVQLRQVDIADDNTTTDDPSGCTTSFTSLAFDIPVTPDDQMFAGKTSQPRHLRIPVKGQVAKILKTARQKAKLAAHRSSKH